VIDSIKKIRENPDSILEKVNEKGNKDNSNLIRSIETKLDVIQSGLDNLYDAIQSGDIKASAVGDRIRKLEEEREMLQSQLDDIKDARPRKNNAKEMSSIINQVGDAWDKLNEDEQKRILRQLIISVTINKESDHEIEWNLLK
jgi:site-specific DNA recombinase